MTEKSLRQHTASFEKLKPSAMSPHRTVRIRYGTTTTAVCVVGTQLTADLHRSAPPKAKFYSVQSSDKVQYHLLQSKKKDLKELFPLDENSVIYITMTSPSEKENEDKLTIQYYGEHKDTVLEKAVLHLTAVEISLDVDADRDGVVEKNNPNKGSWKWGPNGHGAILLVNCDSDNGKKPDNEQNYVANTSDLKDMSLMMLRTKGPDKLPAGYKLALHVSQSDAESIRVFGVKDKYFPLMLNSGILTKIFEYKNNGNEETKFYVEGVRFPDKDFNGLISINLSLLEPSSDPGVPEMPIFTDTVVFRVAPWIMTPNTLLPEEVYVCSLPGENEKFLFGMKLLVEKSGYKLNIIHEKSNRGDRWIQDEMEFGYVDSPHKSFPVVLDSPRDRELDGFPYNTLLGPDFGYVTREPHRKDVGSLDSFGNLEVSPPVTVNGKEYPLGRIIIGVAFPTAIKGRNMTKVVQDFLWAQTVQEPIALFSDWLKVGHVDEFMTFVPAKDKKGFRLLLASPDATYKLFEGLQKDGHGKAKLFENVDAPVTVDEVLANEKLRAENNYSQSCIDWNRDILKKELGLEDEDIIDVPVLYQLVGSRAVAYYPDMVNMIVLGKNLGIPKPYGPKVKGRCALEQEMVTLMGHVGLKCNFIDDFASYHQNLGDVHCGSNVRRKPFDFKWWDMEM